MTSQVENTPPSSKALSSVNSAKEVFVSPQQLADGQTFSQAEKPSLVLMWLILLVMAAIAFCPWFLAKRENKAFTEIPIEKRTSPWQADRLVLDPKNWSQIFAEAVKLERQGRYGEAMRSYTTLLHVSQNKANILFYRGRCHAKMNEFDSAIADFSAAIKQYPDADFYEARANAYRAIGEEAKAHEDEAVAARHR